MKLKTHNIFSFALSLLISVKLLGMDILHATLLSLYLSVAINTSIDFLLGHRKRRRTPYTHSLLGSTVISLLVLSPVLLLVYRYAEPPPIMLTLSLILVSIIVGVSHLLLDMLTAEGVYLLWPVRRSRYAVLRARYDNPLLNAFMVAVSLTLIALVVLDL